MEKTQKQKIWFITGVSRGLGKALAVAVLGAGDIVIGTTRKGEANWAENQTNLHLLPLELTDSNAAAEVIQKAFAIHDRLDVVVNNAGYGLLGAIEEASAEEMKHVFDVNFFGPARLIQAALPILRKQHSGHIVSISSIAGLAPMAGSGFYAAAKCAIEGMSEALAQEVEPLGIKVTLVEPGAFRTDFLSPDSIRKSERTIVEYAATAGSNVQHLDEIAGTQLGDPERGAKAIIAAVAADKPPMHLVLGSDALRRTRENIARLMADLQQWEVVSAGTDYPV